MDDVPSWLLFLISTASGAMASYFGAMMAMHERLVRLETRADAHKDDIDSIRGQLKDLRAQHNASNIAQLRGRQ